jgi:putative ABC transport system substrate-binding protein
MAIQGGRMKRRDAVFALLALGAASHARLGHGQGKARRIGYLSLRSGPNEFEQAFVRGMRERGHVEGTTYAIDYRWTDGDQQRNKAMAAEIMALKPDVVLAIDRLSVHNLRAANPAIPLVVPVIGDAIASGFSRSISRPDGNITGIAVFSIELSRKRLEVFKEAIPGLKRVGALFNVDRADLQSFPVTKAAGEEMGIKVVEMGIRMPEGITPAFAAAAREGVQGVVIVSDTATISHRVPLCDAALAHRMPTIFANRTYLRAGGLMSYGPDLEGAFHRAAYFVDRILKGARPADLPIEQPTRFELVVNLKTAKAIGVTIAQSILLRADEVIQ